MASLAEAAASLKAAIASLKAPRQVGADTETSTVINPMLARMVIRQSSKTCIASLPIKTNSVGTKAVSSNKEFLLYPWKAAAINRRVNTICFISNKR